MVGKTTKQRGLSNRSQKSNEGSTRSQVDRKMNMSRQSDRQSGYQSSAKQMNMVQDGGTGTSLRRIRVSQGSNSYHTTNQEAENRHLSQTQIMHH
jgi:hypothetical protein